MGVLCGQLYNDWTFQQAIRGIAPKKYTQLQKGVHHSLHTTKDQELRAQELRVCWVRDLTLADRSPTSQRSQPPSDPNPCMCVARKLLG